MQGWQMFRVMLNYAIQSQVVHIHAPSSDEAVREALRIAPNAQRAYVIGLSMQAPSDADNAERA